MVQVQQPLSKVQYLAGAIEHLRGNQGPWQHSQQNHIFQLEAHVAYVPLLVDQAEHRRRESEHKAHYSARQENYAALPFLVVAGGDEALPDGRAI